MSKTTLDDIFSQYIRLRDANEYGFCTCISCGKMQRWQDMDCGHFINRKHMSLRYSEINCNSQCRACNRFDEGNLEGYRRGLIIKHGPGIIDKLYLAKHQISQWSKFEMDVFEKELKQKVKELMHSKSIV